MKQLIIRLDDACPFRDVAKWNRMELLLDKYQVKPLIGVIPKCEDITMTSVYEEDFDFACKIKSWEDKGYTLALHGNVHVYATKCGGLNPVNKRSEFAGLPLEMQKAKISEGMAILKEKYGIVPQVFFAPSHTFDENTLIALKECTAIRNISDTIANAPYYKDAFTYVPVQSGVVRNLPFETVTYCYHPNMMNNETEWERLEKFLKLNSHLFISYEKVLKTKRTRNLLDNFYSWLYFLKRKIR